MKSKVKYGLLLLSTTLLLSCQKIQRRKIIKGTWSVEYVQLNGGETNAMEIFLKDYVTGSDCCRYIVDFQDDNTCTGTYYLNDTIDYIVTGEWEMLDFNKVYVNLDKYVNGDLDVDRHNRRNYTLRTDKNIVAALQNSEVKARIEIKRVDI